MLLVKGIFAIVISVIQMTTTEWDSALQLFDTGSSSPCSLSWRMVMFSAHVVFRLLYGIGEMTFLYVSEAALLNILLLASDLYAAVFDTLEMGVKLPPEFWLAFVLIMVGLIIYEAAPSPAEQTSHLATPSAIEFRQRRGKKEILPLSPHESLSMETTAHMNNLSRAVDGEMS